MDKLKSKKWWEDAAVRAIKTMATTFVSTIGTGVIGLFDVDWKATLSLLIMSGISSLALNLAMLPEPEESEE